MKLSFLSSLVPEQIQCVLRVFVGINEGSILPQVPSLLLVNTHNLNRDVSQFLINAKGRAEESGKVLAFFSFLVYQLFIFWVFWKPSSTPTFPRKSLQLAPNTVSFLYFFFIFIFFNHLLLRGKPPPCLKWRCSPVEGILFYLCVVIITCGTPDSHSAQSWKTPSISFNTANKH